MASISELFEVKITNNTTGKYLNINNGIDNTNNYSLVKVTATDFNNQAVTNKNLSLSCDKGHFIDIYETVTDISWDSVNSVVEQDFSWESGYQSGTSRTQVILHCDNAHENQEAIIKTSNNREIVLNDINTNYIIILGVIDYSISSVILKPYFDTTTGILYTGSEYNTFITHTAITDVNGCFEVVYIPTEWGLCTLSCDVAKSQFLVKGFKKIPVTSNKNRDCTFQVDELTRHCRLLWNFTDSSLSLTNTEKLLDTITLPKQEYYPIENIRKATYNSRISFSFSKHGNIYVKTLKSYSATMSVHYEYFEWTY